jgi:hypothetical protein
LLSTVSLSLPLTTRPPAAPCRPLPAPCVLPCRGMSSS